MGTELGAWEDDGRAYAIARTLNGALSGGMGGADQGGVRAEFDRVAAAFHPVAQQQMRNECAGYFITTGKTSMIRCGR